MTNYSGRYENKATDSNGLAKVAVQRLIEHLCFLSSTVLAESFEFCIRRPRQASTQ